MPLAPSRGRPDRRMACWRRKLRSTPSRLVSSTARRRAALVGNGGRDRAAWQLPRAFLQWAETTDTCASRTGLTELASDPPDLCDGARCRTQAGSDSVPAEVCGRLAVSQRRFPRATRAAWPNPQVGYAPSALTGSFVMALISVSMMVLRTRVACRRALVARLPARGAEAAPQNRLAIDSDSASPPLWNRSPVLSSRWKRC